MRKYIFLATTICNMGGAQKYLYSKMQWLKDNGWSVDIVYYQSGQAILRGFDESCVHYIKELYFPTYYYGSRKINRIINNLIQLLFEKNKNYERIIIESTTVGIATWGEILASRVHAKHLVYSLQEKDVIRNLSIAKFLVFKHKRRELAGISRLSVSMMMGSFGYDIPKEESYSLSASSVSPVGNYDYPMVDDIKGLKADFVIGSLGRIDKQYVIPTIKSILQYIQKDKDHRYVLLFIGGGLKEQERVNEINKLCRTVNNVRFFVTGFIYPIPSALIQICDVFFSTSGSAIVSYKEGVPTVSIDGNDLMPIGVLGFETTRILYRDNERIRPIEDYLDEVLKQKKYPRLTPQPSSAPNYEKHIEFLNNSCQAFEYYDMNNIKWNKEQKLQRWFMPIIGPDIFCRIQTIIKTRFI